MVSAARHTFIARCARAIDDMRRAGMDEMQIACIIQDVRDATLQEEFCRMRVLIEENPPKHDSHGIFVDGIRDVLG